MMNIMRIVAFWLAACSLFGPVGGGTAAKVGRRDGLAQPAVKKTIAEADIILYISPPNNTTETKRLEPKFFTGRRLIVGGMADIDGKTFRYGIKGSREAGEGSNRNESGFGINQKPGETFVIVGHCVFDLVELPGANPKTVHLTSRWISRGYIGFAVSNVLPDRIDEANSGTPQAIPPID